MLKTFVAQKLEMKANVIVDTTCTACSSDFSFSHTLRPGKPLDRGLTTIYTK